MGNQKVFCCQWVEKQGGVENLSNGEGHVVIDGGVVFEACQTCSTFGGGWRSVQGCLVFSRISPTSICACTPASPRFEPQTRANLFWVEALPPLRGLNMHNWCTPANLRRYRRAPCRLQVNFRSTCQLPVLRAAPTSTLKHRQGNPAVWCVGFGWYCCSGPLDWERKSVRE